MRRALLILSVAGCAAGERLTRARTVAAKCASDDGTRVVCGELPIAEILCLHTTHTAAGEPAPQRSAQPEAPRACRALGVRYGDDGETVWLYRAGGFDPEHPERPYPNRKVDTAFASAVTLTRNAEILFWRTRRLSVLTGRIESTAHSYELLTGKRSDD